MIFDFFNNSPLFLKSDLLSNIQLKPYETVQQAHVCAYARADILRSASFFKKFLCEFQLHRRNFKW